MFCVISYKDNTHTHTRVTSQKSLQFVWPFTSHRIRDDAAQDKALDQQITAQWEWGLGGGRVGEGVWANWELGPKPGTACHAPGFIQPRFKEP